MPEVACEVAGCSKTAQKLLQSTKESITQTFQFCPDHSDEKEAQYEVLEVIADV